MDAFTLEVLEDVKSWNWPIIKHIQQSGKQGKALVPNLLSCSRGWQNMDPVSRVGGGGSAGGLNFFL